MNISNRTIMALLGSTLTLLGCKGPCKNEISILEGLYFKKGQTYKIEIEDREFKNEEQFSRTEIRGQNFNEIGKYCCLKDSCKIKFSLDGKDTVFYISPLRTKRLMVGSDVYGNFSVATDEDKDAWTKM
jgi:hypothetical protein